MAGRTCGTMPVVALRILVVDDSSAMRAFVRATLEDGGEVLVTDAASGFEALRILPREKFDLVVVDINMPDINGLELVSFIRKSDVHKATPLVVISTEASARDRQRAMDLGANAFLTKPFGPDELRATVRQVRGD